MVILHRPLNQTQPPRGQTPEERQTVILQLKKGNQKHNNFDKVRWTYIVDKGARKKTCKKRLIK